jgi:FKBP-type peptidyl-prolyl cis-trans isomerase
LSLSQTACEPPDQIVPTTPPGAVIPRTPPEGEEAAQAQGESLTAATRPMASEPGKKPSAYTPALPTAKGETKTTKSGVKYETLKEGTGDELKPGSLASFHYEGKLENGTIFDTTRQKGQPATYAIGMGKLIKGWDEALPGMKVGEVRKLVIPPAMAYADTSGPGGKLPPNSTLIFEIELLKILN